MHSERNLCLDNSHIEKVKIFWRSEFGSKYTHGLKSFFIRKNENIQQKVHFFCMANISRIQFLFQICLPSLNWTFTFSRCIWTSTQKGVLQQLEVVICCNASRYFIYGHCSIDGCCLAVTEIIEKHLELQFILQACLSRQYTVLALVEGSRWDVSQSSFKRISAKR
jgi:hypothetical protein